MRLKTRAIARRMAWQWSLAMRRWDECQALKDAPNQGTRDMADALSCHWAGATHGIADAAQAIGIAAEFNAARKEIKP